MRLSAAAHAASYACAGMFCSDFGKNDLTGTIGSWISSMSKLAYL
jgi:hypothetical protein